MSVFVESIGFGLVTSAVLAVASVGFTLQFAVTNVLNLAYGGVMVVSAYAAYAVNQRGVSVWISALAGIAAVTRPKPIDSTKTLTASACCAQSPSARSWSVGMLAATFT